MSQDIIKEYKAKKIAFDVCSKCLPRVVPESVGKACMDGIMDLLKGKISEQDLFSKLMNVFPEGGIDPSRAAKVIKEIRKRVRFVSPS